MMRHAIPHGSTLIELMVSLAIGALLTLGAVHLYVASHATFRTNESIARLQEQARYVLSVIEPDLQLAGNYGFTQRAETLRFIHDGNTDQVVASAPRMRQVPLRPGDPAPLPVSHLPASAHACGTNFAVDVLTHVQGSNNRFALGPGMSGDCKPYGSGHQPGTDTLTVRRADSRSALREAGRLQLYSSRFTSRSVQFLVADGRPPGPLDDNHRMHDLLVRVYYVSRDSVDRPGQPALRVKSLGSVAGAVAFIEDEVMPGVEDLQVQFAIDTGDYDNDGALDGRLDTDGDGVLATDGRATRYVDPDFPDLMRYQVVAVRVWLRLRADEPESGFADDRTYRYADVTYTPEGAERRYRRLLVARTVALRNARTF